MSPPSDDDSPSDDDGYRRNEPERPPRSDPSGEADSDPEADETPPDRSPRDDTPPGGQPPGHSPARPEPEPPVDSPERDPPVDGTRRRAPESNSPGRPGSRPVGDSTRRDAPAPRHADQSREDPHWARTFLVDVGSSAGAVLLVGFFLFTVSGVWPPMVAVESASMTPHMKIGDLVFVMEEERFPGEGAHAETGVVTAREGAEAGYSKFGNPGDVIVYKPNGNGGQTPIIHRAMFWVDDGERWYEKADKGAVGSASSCEELANCPAPHAGFITKGDANPTYDQVGPSPHSGPVKPGWIVGTAEVRVPKLGCIRLRSERCAGVLDASVPAGDLLATGSDGTTALNATG